MIDRTIFLVWEILIILICLVANFLSYKNYKRDLLNIWGMIGSLILLLWGMLQLVSLYMVVEVLAFVNLGFFAVNFIGCILLAFRKQTLSYVGLTVASFILLIGGVLEILAHNYFLLWFSRLEQLAGLGFWTAFLLFPKIEGKFKKEEQKLQKLVSEKENLLNQSKSEIENRGQRVQFLEESLQKQTEKTSKLSIFFEISKTMGASVDREKILQTIPEEIARIWKVQNCGLYLWDKELEVFVLKYGSGFEPQLLNRLNFKKGEGLIGWAALEGKTIRLHEPGRDPRFKDKHNQFVKNKKINFKTTLISPINVESKSLGVIELINYNGWKDQISPQVFSEEDEQMLFSLSSQIALFLQNVTKYEENRDAYFDVIKSLVNAIEARDPYTRGHSEQTTKYALAISQKLNLPQELIESIGYAASLHDIGKIGIKETILKKAKKLTADEYSHIKNHPFMGAQILKPIKSLQEIIPIVYHHHERFDGQGYLDGLQKEEIPIGARILTVADSFEAMTSDRPYHKGLPKTEAIEQLKKFAGTQFDPHIVEIFVEILAGELVKIGEA